MGRRWLVRGCFCTSGGQKEIQVLRLATESAAVANGGPPRFGALGQDDSVCADRELCPPKGPLITDGPEGTGCCRRRLRDRVDFSGNSLVPGSE